ncbi:helix-turn-helix domain-containing protein [Candidatus Pacearchaeota archaeon]|nr:helix-turn-helix domain-containing protein [Candidatus Pacearchaeota archaeon]
MDDKHILVSLGDDKVKQIGEVIGNKTCNKILDLLSTEEMTVTDISQKLKIPLNTADYNIKKLVKSGLIEKSSHFWSVKGKKMPTYKVSNRKIIISPKKSMTKVFVWVAGLTGLTALTIREFTKNTYQALMNEAPNALMGTKDAFAEEATFAGAREMQSLAINAGASEMILDAATSPSFWQSLNPWTWFLFGAWFAIFLFFAFNIWGERKSK